MHYKSNPINSILVFYGSKNNVNYPQAKACWAS